jgi:hypothetical protein
MAKGPVPISVTRRVLVACAVAAATGLLLGLVALGAGVASAHDPYIACANSNPGTTQGKVILDEYKEATTVGFQFSFWPLGTRCTYRAPNSDRSYVDPPDWALTITMVIGMSLAAGAALGAAGIRMVAISRFNRQSGSSSPRCLPHPR